MDVFVEKYCEFPTRFRKPMWQIWHKLMIRFDKDISANFMNYGFQHLDEHIKVDLLDKDVKNRYCIQLYDHVIEKANLSDKDVLEVGSGRGGGASYINRYHKPKTYVGLDISTSIIDFCNMYYNEPGLSFVKGDATNLPFEKDSFDAVINVESARCYSKLSKFFNGVYHVLRNDGYFLFADMIEDDEIETMKHQLRTAGFTIEHKQDITQNVVAALNRDTQRRENLINDKIPGFMKKAFKQFAGTKDSERYESFVNGKFKYMSFVLRKIT